jgi:Phage integrase family
MTVGPRTRRWRHSVLRMVLQYAVEQDWLVKNPATTTTFPRMPTHDHTYLTADEVEHLATLCGAQGDIVLILAYTGLRWGELTGLRVTDINLTTRRLRVRRSITQVGGKPILGTPKSRAGIRTVPIPARIAPLLGKRIEDKAPDSPAITSPRGALLSRENWVRAVRWNDQRKTSASPACASMTCVIPMPRSPDSRAPISGFCNAPWATRPSLSQPIPTRTSTTPNLTHSPTRSTHSPHPKPTTMHSHMNETMAH